MMNFRIVLHILPVRATPVVASNFRTGGFETRPYQKQDGLNDWFCRGGFEIRPYQNRPYEKYDYILNVFSISANLGSIFAYSLRAFSIISSLSSSSLDFLIAGAKAVLLSHRTKPNKPSILEKSKPKPHIMTDSNLSSLLSIPSPRLSTCSNRLSTCSNLRLISSIFIFNSIRSSLSFWVNPSAAYSDDTIKSQTATNIVKN